MIDLEEYRGYKPVQEFGLVTWYRTTRSVAVGRSTKTGAEIRSGTHMTRIVTNANTMESAMKQLDRVLDDKPKEPKMDLSKNLKMDF